MSRVLMYLLAGLFAALTPFGAAGRAAPPDAAQPVAQPAAQTPAAQPAADEDPKHLTLARQLLQDAKETDYQHRPTIVRWKSADAPATCRADCSGLINELLKAAYNLTSRDLQNWLGRQRPLAIHYQRTIAAGKDFDIITSVRDIRPGDVIAIAYPPDADNSGHVMLADTIAEEREPTLPIVEKTTQWTLRVLDSTKLGHGPGDSRIDATGAMHPGLGTGTLRLYVNPDLTIAGYTSSPADNAKFHAVSDRPISIGRVHPSAPTPNP